MSGYVTFNGYTTTGVNQLNIAIDGTNFLSDSSGLPFPTDEKVYLIEGDATGGAPGSTYTLQSTSTAG